jgi:ankyrin repeat protein
MPMQHFGLAIVLVISIPAVAADPPANTDEINKLIDELTKVEEADTGYSPSVSGTAFLPLGRREMGTILFGERPPARSDALRQLVAHGTAAVPHLLKHLSDKRPTKLVIKHNGFIGGLVVGADDQLDDPADLSEYTVTVADLCYVALGQIVNRPYTAVRYQPTAFVFVTAVARSKKVRDEVIRNWKDLTPERHLKSLTRDLLDDNSDKLRPGASVRLAYYYPDALEGVALEQLAKPFYPSRAPAWYKVRRELYAAKSAEERKARLGAFLAKYCPLARTGVLAHLFNDLAAQEDDEELERPQLDPPYRARECLTELFNQPATVKSKDRPRQAPLSGAEHARFVETLIYDRSAKIDRAVRDLFVGADDDYLHEACLRRLVGRGFDADIEAFVKRKRDSANEFERGDARTFEARLGWTRLHQAVDFGLVELVERELRDRAPVNARARDGRTALHWAAAEGKGAIVEALLAAKADVGVKDAKGQLPVQLAAHHDRRGIAQLLVRKGSDVPDAFVAVLVGQADRLAALVKADPAQLELRNKEGYLPLHLAAIEGDVTTVRALLDAGAKVNARDETPLPDGKVYSRGQTPLHLAVESGKTAVSRLLLDRGAEVNAADEIGKRTPLHYAAWDGGAELIELLLSRKADRTAKDKDGRTPLDTAREHENEAAIKLLEKP